ncbi:hypothetical protein J4439_05330 [Candidatus Woesearchaeota archaeon]|nr:hypothetical protein [Candidatus Woesearchaeota archaeon]
MSIFSRMFRKPEEDLNAPPGAGAEEERGPERAAAPIEGMGSLIAEVTRIKAQLEGLGETRKATNERFTRITEQIGELRGMILEAGKSVQKVELSTTKAVGLVESIEPDKFLVMIRKQDAKLEALKGNLESNEVMMQTIMGELKEMRQKIRVFRGIDQVAKMTDEVKSELTEIRKVKAVAERHADRVETFFSEIQKQVRGFEEYAASQKELKDSVSRLTKSVDQLNVKLLQKADKKEVESIITNFREFEDHTTRVIKLLNREFADVRTDFEHRFDLKFRRAEHVSRILQELVKPTPELKKSLQEVKQLAEEEARAQEEGKKGPGLMAKLLGKGKEAPAEGAEKEAEGKE